MGTCNILLVDDDPSVLKLVSVMLRRLNMTVTATADGSAAVSLLRSSTEHFDLLLTDIHLTDQDGLELSRLVLNEVPNIRVLYMTGDTGIAGSLRNRNLVCLSKPFRLQELTAALDWVMSEEMRR